MGLLDWILGNSDPDYQSDAKDNYAETDRNPTDNSDTDGNMPDKDEQ